MVTLVIVSWLALGHGLLDPDGSKLARPQSLHWHVRSQITGGCAIALPKMQTSNVAYASAQAEPAPVAAMHFDRQGSSKLILDPSAVKHLLVSKHDDMVAEPDAIF